MGSRIDVVLETARTKINRLTADELPAALRRGAVLVDIRPAAQRAIEGEVPTALIIERNVLEWRLDPTSAWRIPEADPDRLVVVLCRQGYSSSLAAASLQRLGLDATDVVGGVEAWLDAGLPTHEGPADVRE